MRDDVGTRIAQAFAFMAKAQTFHPVSWTPIRILADGTTEPLPPDEAAAVMEQWKSVSVEVPSGNL